MTVEPPAPTLEDLLSLEDIEVNLYRANTVFDEGYDLYGGQVCAQALHAAGRTVDAGRLPHSLHGYFLRPGDPTIPTVYQVYRDRDGRSFSARRVVAVQNGAVIFNMSTSFQVPEEGTSEQAVGMPDTEAADALEPTSFPRLFGFECAVPTQPIPDRAWYPTRFWARALAALGDDPLLNACALAYLSDISTGVLPARDGSAGPGASLDHAVWFHSPVRVDHWVLTDYETRVAGHGRGWYVGSMFAQDGRLVASLAQETLYRAPRG